MYTPYTEEYLENEYWHISPEGRRYKETDVTAAKPGGDVEFDWRVKRLQTPGSRWEADLDEDYRSPQPGYEDKAVRPYRGRFWAYSKANLIQFANSGHLIHRKTGMPRLVQYADEMLGIPLQDLWTDINPAQSGERLGYPTQKPVALMERIVKSASDAGDVVLDPFCGCGTTLAAAQRLNRKWIGIDISPTAVGLMKRRLEKEGATGVKLVGMPVTEEQLRALKPFEFQNWVIQRMNGTHSPRRSGDMGVDGFSFMQHLPIQVKQSERVGRNVVDNFETAVERNGKDAGYIVAFSFTKGANEEVARAKAARGVSIELVKVADLLEETAELATPTSDQLFGNDAPLPTAPPKEARPSVKQLVKSDRVTDAPS